jgi:hypothetical protein
MLRSRLWSSRTKASNASELTDAVFVDVVFDAGLLYLELVNLGEAPALDVTSSFEPALVDAHGRDVSELLLFRGLGFLAPGRRIRTLLGPSSAYSESVVVEVQYSGAARERHTTRITHELAAFRELAYVV